MRLHLYIQKARTAHTIVVQAGTSIPYSGPSRSLEISDQGCDHLGKVFAFLGTNWVKEKYVVGN